MHLSPGIAQLDQQLEKPPTAERVLTRSKVHVAKLLTMPGQLAEGSAAGKASLNGGSEGHNFVRAQGCVLNAWLFARVCVRVCSSVGVRVRARVCKLYV